MTPAVQVWKLSWEVVGFPSWESFSKILDMRVCARSVSA